MTDEKKPNKVTNTAKNNLPGLVAGLMLGAGAANFAIEPQIVETVKVREPTVVDNVTKTICIEGARLEGKSLADAEGECSGQPKIALKNQVETAIEQSKGRPNRAAENTQQAIQAAKFESRRRDDARFNEEMDRAKLEGRLPARPGEFLSGASNPPSGAPPGLANRTKKPDPTEK